MHATRTLSIPTRFWGRMPIQIHGSGHGEIIICVPGFQATGNHPTITAVAAYFRKQGFGVITFSFPEGTTANIRKQVACIVDIVSYCRKTYPQAAISILGGSLGALSSAIAVTQSNAIDRLITLNGYFGSYFLRGESIRVYVLLKIQALWNSELRDDLWGYIRNNFRPEKISVPTLVIHASCDRVARPIQSRLFYQKIAGKKQLFLYPSVTADHELHNTQDINNVSSEVVRFIRGSHTRRG